ncbi:MAG: hypothetical protein H6837_17220 [Planctomycetes bacterium]|nr:hypothetical protein [Planctomycetota bacterium]
MAVLYGLGAMAHLQSMLGATGTSWASTPMHWRVLDVVYLVLDIVVCIGLPMRVRIAAPAFYLAAASQIALYTLLRPWIADVPSGLALSPAEHAALDRLVWLHAVTVVLVSLALWTLRRTRNE